MAEPQWRHCPYHLRLCEVGAPRDETPEQAAWRRYQEHIRETVRVQWEERQSLLLWLGMVEATHRDTETMAVLTRCLRLGRWDRKLIDAARRLAERVGADALG